MIMHCRAVSSCRLLVVTNAFHESWISFMLPRVVITGMGVVSPNGIGKQDFCRAVLAGKSGVKQITRFDSSNLLVHIGGEIPQFDELAWVDARERKHVSRVVPLCLAATTEAVKDSGLDTASMSIEEKR